MEFKKINYILITLQIFTLIAFGIFIISNLEYILNPTLIPNYNENGSIFEYEKEKFAKFKDWGFFYPWYVVLFLTFSQTIILGILLIKKNKINMSELILTSILVLLLFFLNDVIQFSFYIAIILFLLIIISSFLKKMKLKRSFLLLNMVTLIFWVVFLFTYMKLFFD